MKNHEVEILNRAKRLVEKIIILLKKEAKVWHNKAPTYRKHTRGWLVRGGSNILIHTSSIEHRVILEGFEAVFLDSAIELMQEIFEKIDSLFTEFSFRTLLEICTKRAAIIFDTRIPKKDKKKFKIASLLANLYATREREVWFQHFKKLYDEEKDIFEDRERKKYERAISAFEKNDDSLIIKSIKELRDFLRITSNTTIAKYKIDLNKYQLSGTNREAVESNFSHILHGDFIALQSLFIKYRTLRMHQIRVFFLLIIAGRNLLCYLSENSTNKQFISEVQGLEKDCNSLFPSLFSLLNEEGEKGHRKLIKRYQNELKRFA